MKYKDITGIVLCGGKSSRMGSDKAFLKIEKKTIIEIIFQMMKKVFDNVIIIANRREDYRFLTDNVYRDIFRDMGPLAGLHTGLTYSQTDKNFVISCDMPFVTADIIRYVCDFNTDKLITVPEADSHIQTLCGVYDKSLIEPIEIILSKCDKEEEYIPGSCNMMQLLNTIKPEILKIENLDIYNENLFFNMNNPADYDYVLTKYNKVYY